MFYSFQNKNFVILLLNLFYFYAIVNEAVSLISFWLQAYRNTINFIYHNLVEFIY